MGVDPGSIRQWARKFAPPTGEGVSPAQDGVVALRKENERLRIENKRLLMEREISKKATAFFAKEQP